MRKNMLDRIKLIIQFVVYSLFTWVLLLLPMVFVVDVLILKIEQGQKISLLPVIIPTTILAVSIHGWRFAKKWKKLKEEERNGIFPDMNDMRNITGRQMILFVMGFPFLIASVVLFQLHSKLAGVLCAIPYLVMWGIDIVYVKRRFKRINEGKNIE